MTLSRQRQHALDHIAPIANKKLHNKFQCISISFWLWWHCHRRHHHHVLQIRTVIVQKHIMTVMTCFAVYTYNLLPFYGSNLMKCRIHGKKALHNSSYFLHFSESDCFCGGRKKTNWH